MKVDKFSATALFAFFIFLKIASGQSLRGLVREAKTGDGLYSANVFLMEKSDSALVATTTDLSGGFQIKAPKPGIFSLKISQIGFETRIIPEVELNFGKETILEISLNEAPGELKSVEIRPDGSDGRLPMAGLHLLTRDQVLRYPATFFDPARLAQSLPGVSNDDQNNGISVRGLTPALFQYRIEGLEVVNPNHLSNAGTITDLPTANSGGVSMLSAQMLGNSAIYTGATPVGYGNSVGGLMDIRLRPGNNEHFEGTVQAGLVGLDASVEGPFSKYKKSSYLVNYRYSTIGLLEKLGVQLGDEVVNFQDLSVFLKFPMNRGTSISIFGILGNSSNHFNGKEVEQASYKEFHDIGFDQKSLIVGTVISKKLKRNGKIGLSYAYSKSLSIWESNHLVETEKEIRYRNNLHKNSFRLTYLKPLPKKMQFESGIELVRTENKNNFKSSGYEYGTPGDFPSNENGENHFSGFSQLSIPLGPMFRLDLGALIFYYQHDDLDTSVHRLQPRGAFVFRLNNLDRFVFTFQKGSQIAYSNTITKRVQLESWIGSARLEKHLMLRNKLVFEFFLQKFLPFPVSPSKFTASPSALDWSGELGSTTTTQKATASLGGVCVNWSHSFSNNFFWETNGSFFDSQENFGSSEFINTRFNSRFTGNFLAGKVWPKTLGSNANRDLGITLRLHGRGGFWETPIDLFNSNIDLRDQTVYQTGSENSLRLPTYFRCDLRLFWKKNKKNRTGTLALDVQNVTNRLNVAWHYYDPFLEKIVAKTGLGLVPILSYRLEFQQKK